MNLEKRLARLEEAVRGRPMKETEAPVEAQERAMAVLEATFTSERLGQWLDPDRKEPMSLSREEAEAWAVARGILEGATREAE